MDWHQKALRQVMRQTDFNIALQSKHVLDDSLRGHSEAVRAVGNLARALQSFVDKGSDNMRPFLDELHTVQDSLRMDSVFNHSYDEEPLHLSIEPSSDELTMELDVHTPTPPVKL